MQIECPKFEALPLCPQARPFPCGGGKVPPRWTVILTTCLPLGYVCGSATSERHWVLGNAQSEGRVGVRALSSELWIPAKLPCAAAARAVRLAVSSGLVTRSFMSLKPKKKRKRVHDELFFGGGCQAAHGDSPLLNGARPLPGRLARGGLCTGRFADLPPEYPLPGQRGADSHQESACPRPMYGRWPRVGSVRPDWEGGAQIKSCFSPACSLRRAGPEPLKTNFASLWFLHFQPYFPQMYRFILAS